MTRYSSLRHLALRRIAAGGDGCGLGGGTLDELCRELMFTWVSGECVLTDTGAALLAEYEQMRPTKVRKP